MRLTGQERIAAPRSRVWDALNDPDTLRNCIPGCQSLEKEAADRLRATVEIKIGPIGARFNSTIALSDVQASNSYTLICDGQGGTIGSAKSTIRVRLADDGSATLLSYDVEAEVGGRLAQLGGPLIDATAKQLATKFFKRFGEMVGNVKDTSATAPDAAKDQPASARHSSSPIAWILALAVAVLIGYLIGRATTPQVVLDEKLLERVLREATGGAK